MAKNSTCHYFLSMGHIFLVAVSLLWAFSFGLIKGNLSGLDSGFVAFARLLLSLAVFLPFLRLRKLPSPGFGLALAFVGAVQFGVMYATYIHAYHYLEAHQVALFTIFTPLYVTLLGDLAARRFRPGLLPAAALAVAGAFVVMKGDVADLQVRTGFWLIQASNLCFAMGQVAYRRLLAGKPELRDRDVFGLLYLGAVLVTGIHALATGDFENLTLTSKQTLTLLYLGVAASGVGFFLWNAGARRVTTGVLAVFNNLKIPLAVACSLVFFGEAAEWLPLLGGGGLIVAALALNGWIASRDSDRNAG